MSLSAKGLTYDETQIYEYTKQLYFSLKILNKSFYTPPAESDVRYKLFSF